MLHHSPNNALNSVVIPRPVLTADEQQELARVSFIEGLLAREVKDSFNDSGMTVPDYLVNGILFKGTLSLAAKSGMAKSSTALGLAVFASGAIEHELSSPTKRHVLYFSEDEGQIRRILAANYTAEEQEEIRKYFHLFPSQRVPVAYWEGLKHHVGMFYAGEQAPLLVFDTVNANIGMRDSNSNDEYGELISVLRNSVVDESVSSDKPSIWLVDHTGKSEGAQTARGASAKQDDVSEWCKFDSSGDVRYVIPQKKRYGGRHYCIRAEMITVQWKDIPVEFDEMRSVGIAVPVIDYCLLTRDEFEADKAANKSPEEVASGAKTVTKAEKLREMAHEIRTLKREDRTFPSGRALAAFLADRFGERYGVSATTLRKNWFPDLEETNAIERLSDGSYVLCKATEADTSGSDF